jgi:drug/metabolite transporter (DMT)-like permease
MKLATELGVPKYQIMTFACLSGIVMILSVTAGRRRMEKLKPVHYPGLAALCVLYSLNYFFYLVALPHMPLANFYSIVFLSPILVALLAAAIFHEHLSWKMMAASIIGFFGVLIAVNPQHLFEDKGNWVAYAAALGSTVVFAFQMISLRFLSRHETREVMALYPRIAPCIIGAAGIGVWGFYVMPLEAWFYCLWSGAIGATGWLLMGKAYKMAPAATIAPFQYSEIITGALLGFLIWHDVPSPNVIAGAIIITLSGVYVVTHAQKSSQVAKVLTKATPTQT